MSEEPVSGSLERLHVYPRFVPAQPGVSGQSPPASSPWFQRAARVTHASEERKPKLLDQVREAIRARHYSLRTEEAYVSWIKRFILFHGKRHPLEMGEKEIAQFLSALAVNSHVSASTHGVFRHLKAPEKKGYIRRVGRRALEILSPQGRPVLPDAREVPLLGRVPAGEPLWAEENIEGFLSVAREMAPGKEVFALRVKGNSMIEEGILEGDYVIIQHQQTAENGNVVCALIDGEATLKKFYKKGDTLTYAPIMIPLEDSGRFRILGKVVGLMRKF
jgi:repressor LexA